jgi:hypothetical protein
MVGKLINNSKKINEFFGRAVAEELNIGLARFSEIIASEGYKKCAAWVPCLLVPAMKRARLEACQ